MNSATLPALATPAPVSAKPKKSQAISLPSTDPIYLTQAELCARWKKTPMSLWRYRRLGILPSHKIGGYKVLFALSDIIKIESESIS